MVENKRVSFVLKEETQEKIEELVCNSSLSSREKNVAVEQGINILYYLHSKLKKVNIDILDLERIEHCSSLSDLTTRAASVSKNLKWNDPMNVLTAINNLSKYNQLSSKKNYFEVNLSNKYDREFCSSHRHIFYIHTSADKDMSEQLIDKFYTLSYIDTDSNIKLTLKEFFTMHGYTINYIDKSEKHNYTFSSINL